ncbi:unnamed protein product [Arctia plantaginis]|uniref:TIL domain-containing protein n=1 Tax=Arctia plantaginis TaxID=874455 RepID=A0A8S1ABX3_ARCPL|nr:unnamed protein product [Arctia plantaginis]
MTRYVFICLCIFVITTHAAVQLTCGHYEIPVECPANCPSDFCPDYPNQDRPCPKPEVCGEPECKCRFNTRRTSENRTCIPTQECRPFLCRAPNTEYAPCPAYCPSEDCAEATPDGGCPQLDNSILEIECIPRCRCKRGYWRHNNNCVPYSECPQNKQ